MKLWYLYIVIKTKSTIQPDKDIWAGEGDGTNYLVRVGLLLFAISKLPSWNFGKNKYNSD